MEGKEVITERKNMNPRCDDDFMIVKLGLDWSEVGQRHSDIMNNTFRRPAMKQDF